MFDMIGVEKPCGKFTLTSTGGIQDNIPGLQGQYDLTNLLQNDRVVYKHRNQEIYLYSFYHNEGSSYNGVWMVIIEKCETAGRARAVSSVYTSLHW